MSSIDIGNKVKELMKKNKMTNLELAKLLNIEEQELSEKLSGKEEFLATEATKISNIFKISINDFANIFFNTNKEKIKNIKVGELYEKTNGTTTKNMEKRRKSLSKGNRQWMVFRFNRNRKYDK